MSKPSKPSKVSPKEPEKGNRAMKMLTVKEAAGRLGVSASLVYNLCARNRIAHERHGLGRG